MNKALLILAALLLLRTGFGAGVAHDRNEMFRIWGTITDLQREPLSGVHVYFDDGVHCITDLGGNWARDSLSYGRHELVVLCTGYIPLRESFNLMRDVRFPLQLVEDRDARLGQDRWQLQLLPAWLPVLRNYDLDRDGVVDHTGVDPLRYESEVYYGGIRRDTPWSRGLNQLDENELQLDGWSPGFTWSGAGSENALYASSPLHERAPELNSGEVELTFGNHNWQQQRLVYHRSLGLLDRVSLHANNHSRKTDLDEERHDLQLGLVHQHIFPQVLLQNTLEYHSESTDWTVADPELVSQRVMALGLEDVEDEQQQWLYRLSAGYSPTTELRFELGTHLRGQSSDWDAQEYDYAARRGAWTGDSLVVRQDWYHTARESSQFEYALDASMNQNHSRGLFRADFFFRNITRDTEGFLLDGPEDAGINYALDPWFGTDERVLQIGARLRDVYVLGKGFELDADAAFRYTYYSFERRYDGRFQSINVERLRFEEDLQSLDPTLCLRHRWSGLVNEISFSRRRDAFRPEEWWDQGSYPEDYYGDGIVVDGVWHGGWPLLEEYITDEGSSSLLTNPLISRYQYQIRHSYVGLRLFVEDRNRELLEWVVATESETAVSQAQVNGDHMLVYATDVWVESPRTHGLRLRASLCWRGGKYGQWGRIPLGDGSVVLIDQEEETTPGQPEWRGFSSLNWERAFGSLTFNADVSHSWWTENVISIGFADEVSIGGAANLTWVSPFSGRTGSSS